MRNHDGLLVEYDKFNRLAVDVLKNANVFRQKSVHSPTKITNSRKSNAADSVAGNSRAGPGSSNIGVDSIIASSDINGIGSARLSAYSIPRGKIITKYPYNPVTP